MTQSILSTADVNTILCAASTRKSDDAKYAGFLLNTLTTLARGADLKMRFWDALYAKRPARFQLYQLYYTQQYGPATHTVETILSEYSILERLAAVCGENVISFCVPDGENINIWLEFKPPAAEVVHTATLPVADALEERRHEKATSW